MQTVLAPSSFESLTFYGCTFEEINGNIITTDGEYCALYGVKFDGCYVESAHPIFTHTAGSLIGELTLNGGWYFKSRNNTEKIINITTNSGIYINIDGPVISLSEPRVLFDMPYCYGSARIVWNNSNGIGQDPTALFNVNMGAFQIVYATYSQTIRPTVQTVRAMTKICR